jgi:UDP-N-acetylmuramoyl-L-alanyl-D-glutamate--2,6-diaminopimelate ligase
MTQITQALVFAPPSPRSLAELLPGAVWQVATPADGSPTPWQGPLPSITGLAYDSRQVLPGNLFAAWHGGCADGHAFVEAAVHCGAVALLVEQFVAIPALAGVPQAVLPQVRRSLAEAARELYDDPAGALRMAAVTGTNGKTTCVHLLQNLLEAAGLPTGKIGTLGSDFGSQVHSGGLTTPESVDLLRTLAAMHAGGAQAVALEASSQALAQQRLAGVRFDVALFTNFTQDHLDWHGSMENYLAAKAHLFAALLKPAGVAVFNCDDPEVLRLMQQHPGAKWGFSLQADHPAAQVRLQKSHLDSDGMDLQIQTPLGSLQLHAHLCGSYNVENVVACVTVGCALGLTAAQLQQGLLRTLAVPGRLQRLGGATEPAVWVDYAHTPDALRQALAAVRPLCRGTLLCVFGCGGDRDAAKRRPMGEAAMQGADFVVLTNDNPRSEDPRAIASAVQQGLEACGGTPSARPRSKCFWVQLDRAAAIDLAVRACGPDDAVLIAGKGHENYQIVGTERRDFDDCVEARRALCRRRADAATGVSPCT